MADWYFNTATGNDTTGDGSSGTPYATAQKCWDEASSGDSIYGCGTDTGGVAMNAVKKLNWYGCDASWTVGAAQLVFDGENSDASIFTTSINSCAKYSTFQYLTFKRTTTAAINASNFYSFNDTIWRFCIFENNGGIVFDGSSLAMYRTVFWRCIFRSNTGRCFDGVTSVLFRCLLCRFSDNSDSCIGGGANPVLVGCLCEGNTGYFWQGNVTGATGKPYLVLNCVVDNNSNGFGESGDDDELAGIYVGNRFTDNTTAIHVNVAAVRAILAGNYFHGNTTDITAGRYRELEANLFNQASDGYEDQASEDFNLADDASYRAVALSLDWDT